MAHTMRFLAAIGISTILFCDQLPAQTRKIGKDSKRSSKSDKGPYGIGVRVPWTGSKIKGTPDPPPPYTVKDAFPRLKFELPVVITNAPGTDRLFVAERGVGKDRGRIYSFPNDRRADKNRKKLALDLMKLHPKLQIIYGLTFHPDFERNRYAYVCYILETGKEGGSRVARFKVSRDDPPRFDPKSEKKIFTWWGGGHNGGCLKFGPDGYLYISTGDGVGPSPPDPKGSGQDVSNYLSSILRIDVDNQEGGKAYRIPPDNPFVDLKGARPEIWAFGFRNPWKMSFDRATGDLWVGDVGWELWEMIYRVERGGNYGWSVMEGSQPVHPTGKRGPTPILPPTVEHPHSEAASITGGFVYHGSRLPELAGGYIYGDYQSGMIWGILYDGKKVKGPRLIAKTSLRLVGFCEDNDGELYLLDHDGTGKIYRLEPNSAEAANADFPTELSRTGLFESTEEHAPAPGVIPYSINAPAWADHTYAERFLAVPGAGKIELQKNGVWKFANGSVLARTVYLDLEAGNPDSRRKVETQVLHHENDSWRPYTYVWNDEQTDATLADAKGFNRTFEIRDSTAPGGVRNHEYRFSARSECQLCHNPWVGKKTTVFGLQSASPLAAMVGQFDRDHDYGGTTDNQMRTLRHIGLLGETFSDASKSSAPFANPYDESADFQDRSRAYLHVNCSHCHQFNAGGAANILLTHSTPLKDTKTVDVRPTQGTFGISNARIIAPGDPNGSVLYYRMAKLGSGHMPRIGVRLVDEQAIDLMYRWIEGLPGGAKAQARRKQNDQLLEPLVDSKDATPEQRAEAIGRLTETTRGALALLRAIDTGAVPKPLRDEVVEATRNHASVEVRDLFERFVPESERIRRLGDVIEPAEILALPGNVQRGKEVFFANSATQCKNRHRVDDTGGKVGPELTLIGKKYGRPQLLDQILDPSKQMDPQYIPYLLETKDGEIFAGLLVTKDDREVVLKDAQDKEIRVAASDIELLAPRAKSLMPDLLLRDMTAQQVADLLAYLASLKPPTP